MNRISRSATAAALGALAGLLLVACGGDTNEPAPAPATASATTAAAVTPTAAATPAEAVLNTPATPALPVTVNDKDGKPVTIKDASRIIPLNGDIAEVVWALGLGGNVVGTDTSATYPAAAAASTKIGYQRTLSAEGILALKPSLIIGNENAGPPAVIDQLRSAGVTVVLFKHPSTLDAIPQKIRDISDALGIAERGDILAKKTQGEIDAARILAATATTKPSVMFLYLRGASTQIASGKGYSAESLITSANATDAGAASGIVNTAPLTPEALVAAQPQVLLLLDAGLQSVGGVDGLLKIPGIAQTPAGKDRKVVSLDDQYLLGFGPRAGQALADLVRLLHPELTGR